ncbi:S-formylglutathione hydrolase [Lamellibrachia satsuma]|nr:S-formylglutathione hydrolase [Lamellibrachia satsuma]
MEDGRLPKNILYGQLTSGASGSATEWCLIKLQNPSIKHHYPLLRRVAEVALALLVSNASILKWQKNRLCSNLKNDLLTSLLHISLNGSEMSLPTFRPFRPFMQHVVQSWLAEKKGRKLLKESQSPNQPLTLGERLTCTEENFVAKAGAQRGCNIKGEEDCWDFGTGAGFYLDATEDKWKTNYRMYSYVTKELPELVQTNFPVIANKQSIFGHSMGGHGALVCFLRNPRQYASVSAFAPICNPSECPWGQKAFGGYLGSTRDHWKRYDACHLMQDYDGPKVDILIDQGKADNFLTAGQLLPDNLTVVCAKKDMPLNLRMQDGYDHSYYFIASFIGDHIAHHAKHLKA